MGIFNKICRWCSQLPPALHPDPDIHDYLVPVQLLSPPPILAVKVTDDNLPAVLSWCSGSKTTAKFTVYDSGESLVGDWLVQCAGCQYFYRCTEEVFQQKFRLISDPE